LNCQDFNNLAGGFQAIVTPFILIFGGWWAYKRFVRQREKFPFIEFTADIVLIGMQKNCWIVELVAYIENKGKVRHKIETFDFDLVALSRGDEIATNEIYGNQVDFTTKVAKGSFLPKSMNFFFIDPGVKAKYSYVALVPLNTSFLNLHAWFNYTDQEASHVAERTIKIPDPLSQPLDQKSEPKTS
jgi:hypothetical protein